MMIGLKIAVHQLSIKHMMIGLKIAVQSAVNQTHDDRPQDSSPTACQSNTVDDRGPVFD